MEMNDARGYRIEVFPPHPALAPFVECYRRLSGVGAGFHELSGLPLWPGATTEMNLVLGGCFDLEEGLSTFSAGAGDGFVVGPKVRVDLAGFGPSIELLNIGFAPGGAAALLGTGTHETSGLYLRLEELEDRSLANLNGMIGHLSDMSTAERVSCVESWLLRQLVSRGGQAEPNTDVVQAQRLVDATGGRTSVRDLERELGRTRRTLERLFKDRVGVSPKDYARLVRVRRAKRMISETSSRQFSLGLIAQECGYHDQSHMTKEFRRIAGLTPATLRNLPIKDGIVAFLQEPANPAV